MYEINFTICFVGSGRDEKLCDCMQQNGNQCTLLPRALYVIFLSIVYVYGLTPHIFVLTAKLIYWGVGGGKEFLSLVSKSSPMLSEERATDLLSDWTDRQSGSTTCNTVE